VRLFLAVNPPEAVAAELATEVAALRALPDADRLRWAEPVGWHLTLAFYGEVGEEKLPGLCTRLERGARRHHPFEIRLCGGGRFGDRALWTGTAGAREAMTHLAVTAQAAGRRAGVTHDDPHGHTYRPHLTVARNRDRRRADRVALRPYAEALDGFASANWQVAEVTLVHSLLPVSGVPGEQSRYERVAAWPLGG
jgi:RNA 2',3'-cyclic 3'-phosphodiesterase